MKDKKKIEGELVKYKFILTKRPPVTIVAIK